MTGRRSWRCPLALSGVILLSQVFPLPSVVRDAATYQPAREFIMSYPFWHLVFTPFCSVADYLTSFSVHESEIFILWFAILAFALGGLRRGLLLLMAFII